MAKAIFVGEVVADNSGSTYVYGGPNEHGAGWFSIKFNLRTGQNTVNCDAVDVIPVEHVEDVNLRDSRIVAQNLKAEKPRSAAGSWYVTAVTADGPLYGGWFKTKRAGMTECAMRLQIEDWHNS